MNAIELISVNKKFKNFSIDNINLSLPSGSVTGIVGKNGSGKSSLLKMLVTAVLPDSGEIKILGSSTQSDKFFDIKEHIGYVPDGFCFPFYLNAYEINEIMKKAYSSWNEDIFFDYLDRFEVDKSKKYADYSKGMIPKLSIAVALAHDSRILIMDEPSSGLDLPSRDIVIDIVTDFTRNEEHSVIISSHSMRDLSQICDYIVYIKNGKLIFCEEKDILCEKYSVLQCSGTDLKMLDNNAVIGVINNNAFNTSVIIKKAAVPTSMHSEPASLHDIMLCIEKEEEKTIC